MSRPAFSCRISPREHRACWAGKHEILVVWEVPASCSFSHGACSSCKWMMAGRRPSTRYPTKAEPGLGAEAPPRGSISPGPSLYSQKKNAMGHIQASHQEFSSDYPLFVRKHPILKSLFPLFLEILLSEHCLPFWFGRVPLGADSHPGEGSRKCLFFISKLVLKKNCKRKTWSLLKEAKSTKCVKLKQPPPLPCQQPLCPWPSVLPQSRPELSLSSPGHLLGTCTEEPHSHPDVGLTSFHLMYLGYLKKFIYINSSQWKLTCLVLQKLTCPPIIDVEVVPHFPLLYKRETIKRVLL